MTDDLVKRLRDGATTYNDYLWRSADRIEAMQAYIDAAEDVFDYELIFARKPRWTRLQEAREKLKGVGK
jgi:hypothetical protein